MTTATQIVTADELNQFPNDGKRREVIGGELYVSPAPARVHQELSMFLSNLLFQAIFESGAGMVYASPVDVRFSELDQVQPDLIAIKKDRLDIYQGHIVHGAPDIAIEILSPSNRAYDEIEKRHLYATAGVPEYWLVDPEHRRLTILRLAGKDYEPVKPSGNVVKSRAVVDFEIDAEALFARLDAS